MYADGSRAVEVDPKTGKVVWETPSAGNRGHFSRYISAAERLPNGNTLITSGQHGRLFEVTNDFEIVWEYIHTIPHIFRSHRYGPDFAPQFKNLPPAKGPAVAVADPASLKMPTAGQVLPMRAKGQNKSPSYKKQ